MTALLAALLGAAPALAGNVSLVSDRLQLWGLYGYDSQGQPPPPPTPAGITPPPAAVPYAPPPTSAPRETPRPTYAPAAPPMQSQPQPQVYTPPPSTTATAPVPLVSRRLNLWALYGYDAPPGEAPAGGIVIPASATGAAAPAPEGGEAEETGPTPLNVPYAFYNSRFGIAGGWVYGGLGWPQPQSRVLGTVMVGSKGSAMGFGVGQDIRIFGIERLFLDPIGSVGYFNETDSYINGRGRFANERAGSNGSDEDNFVTGSGFDNFFRMKFKYLLPVGQGVRQVLPTYELDRGILIGGASGAESFDPFASGRTFFEVRPFYRSQEIDGDIVDETTTTNGADFGIFWDNRDFPQNPSRGQGLEIKVSQDFGLFDSDDAWTNLEAEYDQYFSFGESDWFRQQVLALDVWTAWSPSWDEQRGNRVDNRPPSYTGATLGGIWRLRGYPSQRFNDRAALYYAAELRLIPHWNPFDAWPVIQDAIGVEWIQFVPFFEIGRVAQDWSITRFHDSMKWSAGLGLRARLKGFVVRADPAVSPEGFGLQMMINQPFQF